MLRAPFLVKALSHTSDAIKVLWKDGASSVFPNIWLRSTVRDPLYFSFNSSMYTENHLEFVSKDVPIKSVEVVAQPDGLPHGQGVNISWDDHQSVYDASWLRAQDSVASMDLKGNKYARIPWDHTVRNMPEYSYKDKDTHFVSWLTDLRKYGVLVVHDVPKSEEGLRSVLQKIGPLWPRIHPTDVFTLFVQDQRLSVDIHAYGSNLIDSHTDTSYYLMPSKLLSLLGIEYSAPSNNKDTYTYFGDGLTVVEDLRQEDPDAFELLSTTKLRLSRRRLGVEEPCDPSHVPMYNWDTCADVTPIIMEGDKLKRLQIFFAKIGAYDIHNYGDQHMKKFLKAYKAFQQRLNDPKYHFNIVIRPGTLVIADNHRLCHGRLAINHSTQRKIMGCYTADEIWRSRWRLVHGEQSGLPGRWLFGCSDEALEILSERMSD